MMMLMGGAVLVAVIIPLIGIGILGAALISRMTGGSSHLSNSCCRPACPSPEKVDRLFRQWKTRLNSRYITSHSEPTHLPISPVRWIAISAIVRNVGLFFSAAGSTALGAGRSCIGCNVFHGKLLEKTPL